METVEDNRKLIAASATNFPESEKAASVIPNNVFQVVACRRPIDTRDTPAVRELQSDAPPCVYLVPAAEQAG